MTLEEFERTTEQELRQKANECFAKSETAGTGDKPYLYLEAQFYIGEIERRHHSKEGKQDRRTALRDFVLEIVVILLIGGEIWLAYKQGKDEDLLMDKQNGVLQKLEDSSSATAGTLTALETTTDAMSKAVEAQLAIANGLQVQIDFENVSKRMRVRNTGNTNITLYGRRFLWQNEPASLEKQPIKIPAKASQDIQADYFYDELAGKTPPNRPSAVPVELYLKDYQNVEYVAQSTLVGQWVVPPVNPLPTRVLQIHAEPTSVLRKDWVKEIKHK
jgi:hypothetical protein